VRRAFIVIAVLAFAGCGQDEPEVGVGGTVRAYLQALKARDGERICTLYSKDYAGLIERESKGSCAEQEARRASDPTLRFRGEKRDGDHATATLDCEDSTASDCSLPLKIEGGKWKVDGSPSPND
jgi:hypothetical protein